MANISTEEKKKLFNRIRHLLGAPVREIELVDEQLETLLEVAIEDYSKMINEWLIDQQWSSLIGLDVNVNDLSFAFMTKSLDFERSFSFAYSKQVGLGTNGPWELKQDYVELTGGTQVYNLPANRELNEILWFTPSMIGSGLDPLSSSLWSAQQFGWNYAGTSAGYVQPLFNTLLAAGDKELKNKVRKSELTYRITGGHNGTKNLHLYPVPGGPFDPGHSNGVANQNNFVTGSRVWYWYYDTSTASVKDCLNDNTDIIRTLSDPVIDNISYTQLNAPAQTWIRQYLLALAKATLGKVRGKYSGSLNVTDVEVTMDYADLLAEGKEEKDLLITQLGDRLLRMSWTEILKAKAEQAEALNQILSKIPNGIQAI